MLDAAHAKLTKIVHDRFDAAAEAKDDEAVVRFLKLFPLLHLHAEGIGKYARYLCSKLARKAEPRVNKTLEAPREEDEDAEQDTAFVDTLTFLFELVAQNVRENEPLLDTHFGEKGVSGGREKAGGSSGDTLSRLVFLLESPSVHHYNTTTPGAGHMTMLLRWLQAECDRLACNILTGFVQGRDLEQAVGAGVYGNYDCAPVESRTLNIA